MDLIKIILSVIFVFTAIALVGADSQVYVERIEFRGIKNIDKYEVIRNSKAKISEKGIVINIENLKEVMNSNVMIENYDIDIENNMLVITIDEKYPLFIVLRVEKNISIPCLVDENRNVIDSGRFFRTVMPIIIVEKEFFEDESNGLFIKNVFDNLSAIEKEKTGFAGELDEVEIYPNRELRVKLKSRKTDFFIKNDLSGFKKIEKSAAYLDAVNSYPETLDLRDKRVLIRQ